MMFFAWESSPKLPLLMETVCTAESTVAPSTPKIDMTATTSSNRARRREDTLLIARSKTHTESPFLDVQLPTPMQR